MRQTEFITSSTSPRSPLSELQICTPTACRVSSECVAPEARFEAGSVGSAVTPDGHPSPAKETAGRLRTANVHPPSADQMRNRGGARFSSVRASEGCEREKRTEYTGASDGPGTAPLLWCDGAVLKS